MTFGTIGFHAAMILNRLRNERRIQDDNRNHDECGSRHNQEEESARRELADIKRRLADLDQRGLASKKRTAP